MKPLKGTKLLRKGRASIKNQHYLITTTVYGRKPFFKNGEVANIVLDSLYWFDREGKIELDAAIVMPNHLHVVAGLKQGSLAQFMGSLKSFTAKQINLFLKRAGKFWQPQYHDHAIRDDEDLKSVVLYVLNNPVRAGLITDFHDYPYWYCRFDV